MRLLTPTLLAGSLILGATAYGQSMMDHAAAAAGATIGTAGGKSVSNALTKVFGSVDQQAAKAAAVKEDPKARQIRENTFGPGTPAAPAVAASSPEVGSAPTPGPATTRSRRRYETSVDLTPRVLAAAPVYTPPAKEPTMEEFSSIQVGATELELVAALGQPASKVTIPDDGHMLEICQYWAKGKRIGTVRLDNGQVVTVERQTEN